jgi:poly(3-hydroxybutyrate) depolymerase
MTRIIASRRKCSTIVAIIWVLCPALMYARSAQVESLKAYSIRSDEIFVAGISSGGAMAMQLDVAYSATFKGAAIYAGLPYYCAQDGLSQALVCDVQVTKMYVTKLEKITQRWAQEGLIDPVQNLRNQPIYLWSGKLDTTVRQEVVDALRSYYVTFSADVFQYDNHFAAGHGWESPYGPVPCSLTTSPFVIRCNDSSGVYDSEQVWIARFFGKLEPKNEGTLNGALLPFNQNEFAGNDAAVISMAGTGYVFVPRSCANGAACGLLLALHGCEQGESVIGKSFINHAGINQWADTNDIVVLYPQAIANVGNPLDCWDWWGYLNDPRYPQKAGPQMLALYEMVERVTGRSPSPP